MKSVFSDPKTESRTFLDKLRLNSYINLDRTERNAFESRQKVRRRVTNTISIFIYKIK